MAERGRPTKYKSEYAHQAKVACRLGATDENLAELFEVDITTINEWKHVHPNFSQSLNAGKNGPNELVEQSLFSRAMGCSVKETKVTSTGEQIIIDRNYPPDTAACFIWLKNRDKKRWRADQALQEQNDGGNEKLAEAISDLAAKLPD